MTAEDKIHWGLLVATATLTGVVFLGPGSPSAATRAPSTPSAVSSPAFSEVSRAELEAAITRLKRWVESAAARARDPLALSLVFQGLGQAGLVPAPPSSELASLLSGSARSTAEDDPLAALGILIEGGLPLERQLLISSDPLSVRELAERALGTSTPPGEPNAWELDLLSLLRLRGVSQYDERLAHLTHSSLRHLDLGSRDTAARPGGGGLGRQSLRERAEAWRAAPKPAHELQLSMATFRALGVLDEPALELQARLHLKQLLFRYATDRALYEYLVVTATDRTEQAHARLEAMEYLGRLEQALYGAHLAFRRSERPDPEGHAGKIMRQAAGDLVRHLRELEKAGVFAAPFASSSEDAGKLRAAVHALRGLRTARSAAGT